MKKKLGRWELSTGILSFPCPKSYDGVKKRESSLYKSILDPRLRRDDFRHLFNFLKYKSTSEIHFWTAVLLSQEQS